MVRKNQRSRGASACGSAQSVKLSKNLTILEKKTYGYQERDEEKRQEFRLKGYQLKAGQFERKGGKLRLVFSSRQTAAN